MTTSLMILICILTFLYGITVGSFLNVCIYRIPKHEDIVKERSHCMSCGYQLRWYDLIPVFSYIFLKGKCRNCGEKISLQYPVIEASNGLLWVAIILLKGVNVESLLYCLLFSALLALSIIDWRTFEIPVGFNIFIALLGLVKVLLNYRDWLNHLIGALCVSLFLYILYVASKGKAIGGGDIKLMAAAGLFLGWKEIIFAFMIGCVLGATIHVYRMKISKAMHVLAMGPYLSFGIAFVSLFGKGIIEWYVSLFMNI